MYYFFNISHAFSSVTHLICFVCFSRSVWKKQPHANKIQKSVTIAVILKVIQSMEFQDIISTWNSMAFAYYLSRNCFIEKNNNTMILIQRSTFTFMSFIKCSGQFDLHTTLRHTATYTHTHTHTHTHSVSQSHTLTPAALLHFKHWETICCCFPVLFTLCSMHKNIP